MSSLYRKLSSKLNSKLNSFFATACSPRCVHGESVTLTAFYVANVPRTSKKYMPGDVVLKEDALITCCFNDKLVELTRAARILELDARPDGHVRFFQYLLCFMNASEVVQRRVLSMTVPGEDQLRGEEVVESCLAFCNVLGFALDKEQDECPLVLRPLLGLNRGLLLRIVLVWLVYGHTTPTGAALYEQASRISHTCTDANTVQLVHGDRCLLIATQPLTPGTVLTVNHLETAQRLMATRCRRQWLLSSKLFTCYCPACAIHPDIFRLLPCPKCRPVPKKHRNGRYRNRPLNEHHQCEQMSDCATSTSGSAIRPICQISPCKEQEPEMTLAGTGGLRGYVAPQGNPCEGIKPWVCVTCHCSFSDAKVKRYISRRAVLWGHFPDEQEEDIEDLVIHMAEMSTTMTHLQDVHSHCCAVLGPRHWSSNMVVRYMIEGAIQYIATLDLHSDVDFLPVSKVVASLALHMEMYDQWMRTLPFHGTPEELCPVVVRGAWALVKLLQHPDCPESTWREAVTKLCAMLRTTSTDIQQHPWLPRICEEANHVQSLLRLYQCLEA